MVERPCTMAAEGPEPRFAIGTRVKCNMVCGCSGLPDEWKEGTVLQHWCVAAFLPESSNPVSRFPRIILC